MIAKKRRITQKPIDPEQFEGSDSEHSSDDPNKLYEVEAILDHWPNYLGKENNLRYLVAWKGYDPSYNTWEPLECLDGCMDMLKEYNERLEQERKQHERFLQTGSEKSKRECQMIDPAYMYEGFDLRTVKADEIPEEQREIVSREVAICHFGLMESWELSVKQIVAVRMMEDDSLAFDLDFERGFQFSFKLAVVQKRCPHKLIAFLMQRNGLQQNEMNAPVFYPQNAIVSELNQSSPHNLQQGQNHTIEISRGSSNEVEILTEPIRAPWEN